MNNRLEQLTKLHDMDPNDPFCTYGIAQEHVKAGRYDEATIWFDRTIEIDAHYCYAFYHKAKILNTQGDHSAAHQVLCTGMEAARAASDAHALEEMQELLEDIGG